MPLSTRLRVFGEAVIFQGAQHSRTQLAIQSCQCGSDVDVSCRAELDTTMRNPHLARETASRKDLYFLSRAFCNSCGAIDFTLIGLAGMPPTMWNGETSFEATPIDPTMACSPTLTPLSTVA